MIDVMAKMNELEESCRIPRWLLPLIFLSSFIPGVSVIGMIVIMGLSDRVGKKRMEYGYYCGHIDAPDFYKSGWETVQGW